MDITKDGLPIVSRDTLEVFKRDHDADDLIYEEIYKAIMTENKSVSTAIHTLREIASENISQEAAEMCTLSALWVYELLRRQSESNNLEKSLGR